MTNGNDGFALMASYNRWMNERLYALCAEIADTERRADRGAFFGSLHGTLNHLLWGDLSFMARFTGTPTTVPPLGSELHHEFAALRAARESLDARIEDWAPTVDGGWLAAQITFTSRVDGRSRTLPHWALVTQMFNHQTHHRGQATTLLSQLGLDIGSTDIPFMPEFEAQ